MVLSRCGIQDEVLVTRLFTGFQEEGKVEYREFMRALVCGSEGSASSIAPLQRRPTRLPCSRPAPVSLSL